MVCSSLVDSVFSRVTHFRAATKSDTGSSPRFGSRGWRGARARESQRQRLRSSGPEPQCRACGPAGPRAAAAGPGAGDSGAATALRAAGRGAAAPGRGPADRPAAGTGGRGPAPAAASGEAPQGWRDSEVAGAAGVQNLGLPQTSSVETAQGRTLRARPSSVPSPASSAPCPCEPPGPPYRPLSFVQYLCNTCSMAGSTLRPSLPFNARRIV